VVVPAEHVLSIVSLDAVVAHQISQYASAQRLGQLGDGLRIELGGVVDAQRALGIELEHRVANEQVAMWMGVQAGSELVRKHDGPDASVAWRAGAAGTNVRFDAAHAQP
jgi:hypothetical protein